MVNNNLLTGMILQVDLTNGFNGDGAWIIEIGVDGWAPNIPQHVTPKYPIFGDFFANS